MSVTDRLVAQVTRDWELEQERMKKTGKDLTDQEARYATVHSIKYLLQIPVGMGAMIEAINGIRSSCYLMVLLLAYIAYKVT